MTEMKKKVKKTVLWAIIIMCGLGIIGVGFELGTSDPAQTEPAVQPGGQMNAVVVTTPVPSATIVAVQTKVATSSPTTVAAMTSESQGEYNEWSYGESVSNKPGGGFLHYIVVDNYGSKVTLKKTLDVSSEEHPTEHFFISVEVPPKDSKIYFVTSDEDGVIGIKVAGK